MNRHTSKKENLKAFRLLSAITFGTLAAGFFAASSPARMLSYWMILLAILVPAWIWMSRKETGLPTLPVVTVFYFIYFALPILRNNETLAPFTSAEIERAAFTVCMFLLSATLTWRLYLRAHRKNVGSFRATSITEMESRGIVFVGLFLGILFFTAAAAGKLGIFGSFLGLVRSIAVTAASLACYLAGCLRARGTFFGVRWAVTVAAITGMIALSWTSLFLFGGVVLLGAAGLGYLLNAKRIPLGLISPALVILTVLHAGKAEMRENHWFENKNFGAQISLLNAPAFFVEWAKAGISTLSSGGEFTGLSERATLVDQLLWAERLAPSQVPYLNGATYALFPSMIVPRFLAPEKVTSQAAMMMLNIHFGFQTADAANVTALGWGLVSEGYANFGLPGVFAAGLAFGIACGILSRWSSGQSPTSLPTLATIAAMMSLINMEADFSYLMINLWQAVAAIFLLLGTLRLIYGSKHTHLAYARVPARFEQTGYWAQGRK